MSSKIVNDVYSKLKCIDMITSGGLKGAVNVMKMDFEDLESLTWQILELAKHSIGTIRLLKEFHQIKKSTESKSNSFSD
jgi:hypothetical protein